MHRVQTACRTLLEKGISSAPELARGSGNYVCCVSHSPTGTLADICVPLAGLKVLQLHSALLVLIQHNYVNCYLQSEDTNPRRAPISIPLYAADLPAILQSLR